MSELIYLSNVRLSFPHLVEPQRTTNKDTGVDRISYNCEFIMDNTHDGFKQFMTRYSTLALEKWKENATAAMNMINNERKSRCYGSGHEKVSKKTFAVYKGYDGKVFISAGRDTPPQLVQADGKPADPSNTMLYQQLARKLYGGCNVNAAVKPWLQANTHGNGIRCDLVAIQFLSDNEAFGEGDVDVTGVFGATAATPAFAAAPATTMPLPPFMMGN